MEFVTQNLREELHLKVNETLMQGHCHAIWQLDEKVEGVFASIESQNYWSSSYWRLFDWYWSCFLSPVAKDGMDGNGLKIEKNGQFKFWC